ncbi:catalase [Entomobacter blattae]|uniref:Catalase n=1 Tax=Entomobacter blattae TaxID=2762277 RepID=A0A7H1NQ61_9PROT|nr:catalase [Entomobacter blattae]QNT77921.1 Catalase [Entomobacter blattae]
MKTVYKTTLAVLLSSVFSFSVASAQPHQLTEGNGRPIGNNMSSKTAGVDGPVLLEDFSLIEKLAHFDRERIPERVVHARGVGVFGEYVETEDFSNISKAVLFEAGKKTPVFVRFSTVMNFRGSPEAARDPRGFAVKFYTEQGNWDLTGLSLPVFFIRDAVKFPDFVHANKPDPVTNIQDPNNAFDFFSNMPESTHILTYLYTDYKGMPVSYRKMDGHGVHAFRLVNAKGETHFVKFHWKSLQGIEGMNLDETMKANTSYATHDLYEVIGKQHKAAKWDLYVQVLTPEQAAKLPYDAFDDTKEWLGVPERKIGTMTLNRMPDNFFETTEQAAFDPGIMIPGIEPSPDKMLQGRLFSYGDTQRYRIGANFLMLPVNRPRVEVHFNQQDGHMNFGNRKGHVNYQPTSRLDDPGATVDNPKFEESAYEVSGQAKKQVIKPRDDYSQAGQVWVSLSDHEKEALIRNLSYDLNGVTIEPIKIKMVSHFYKANVDYGTRLAKATHLDVAQVKQVADKLPNN